MKLNHWIVTACAGLAISGLMTATHAQEEVEPAPEVTDVTTSGDVIEETAAPQSVEGTAYGPMGLGDPNAPAVLVEYASLTCGHCAHFNEDVVAELKPRIEAGELRYELREFLTAPAAVSMAGYQIARCTGEDSYFDVVDYIFTNQYDLLMAAQNGKAKGKLIEIAGEFGLNEDQFMTCLLDEKLFDSIAATIDEGMEQGVHSTPTLFLNGEEVAREDYTLDGLNALIDELNGITPEDEASEN